MREKEFAGKKYQGKDGSVIYYGDNKDFIWYQSDDCHDDNYYKGTYEFYFAEQALEYIVSSLSQFGVTKEKMGAYFERNAGNEFYRLENYCCMVLHNEELMMNGECRHVTPNESYYMGFYADGYLDAANMQTGNYAMFTRVDEE